MSVFGELYARCYDLLYRDKDYDSEVNYLRELINRFNPSAKTILDLGCGTGRHDHLLAGHGYQVLGIDLSEEMLQHARKSGLGQGNVAFEQGDIRKFRTDKKFDVILAMFHVVSYMPGNSDVLETLSTMESHLADDGIIIFDFWYGPAVLTIKPEVKIKRLADSEITLTRISEPDLLENQNCVDVNFDMFVKENSSGNITELREKHRMRYFFLPELQLMLSSEKLALLSSFEFMSFDQPGLNAWNACVVVKKAPNPK
jgi:SAM-dependent methyltransferase